MEIVSDFDGTIVNIDTVEYLLDRFANGDWRRYDDLYERSEIPLEECLLRQYEMIKEPERKLIDALDNVVSFRDGFDELVSFTKKEGIAFTIASAGLDFVIRHLLSCKKVQDQFTIFVPKSKFTSRGIVLDFSMLPVAASSNFKGNVVQTIKARSTGVAYIGDGFSDFEAIKEANVRFVIKGSRLDKKCAKYGVMCHEINGLEEVIRYLVGSGTTA